MLSIEEDTLGSINTTAEIEAGFSALEERLLDLGVLLRRPLAHDDLEERLLDLGVLLSWQSSPTHVEFQSLFPDRKSMVTTAQTFVLPSIFRGVAEHIRDWLVGFDPKGGK